MPNRLGGESSPYLLQHADNPVDWYPWSGEALDRAEAEDKPIFLSIGYSACHWCHVMEHESFEDERIAALLNEHFICIKVDREERPDLDQIYMQAVQMLTGRGGWPMSVFLTPSREPFYGGTYWPPQRRAGMPGFDEVLQAVLDAWTHRRDQAREQAGELTARIRSQTVVQPGTIDVEFLAAAAERIAAQFDHTHGGFGQAPKFPHSMAVQFLLRMWSRDRERSTPLLKIVTKNLDCMADGGIYDHLAGGFARYSVDERWLVPHFEKMLYDNALLTDAYLDAFTATRRSRYAQVANEICTYVLRTMTDERGGFYSTEDADSEGVEGKFYGWTRDEIEQVLGATLAAKFAYVYDVSEQGNFEGQNILHLNQPLERAAELQGWNVDELRVELEQAKQKLREVRDRRVHPAKDDKILTNWNGLMIHSMARAGSVLGQQHLLDAASRAAEFFLVSMRRPDGGLWHTYRHGVARLVGYLDDYASLANALVTLYESTFADEWLVGAVELAEVMLDRFRDPSGSGLFFTAHDQLPLIARVKDIQDSSLPSGNALAATALLRLGHLGNRADYVEVAEGILQLARPLMQQYPLAVGQMLIAADWNVGPVKQVVLAADVQSSLPEEVRGRYLPRVVLAAPSQTDHLQPLVRDKDVRDDHPRLYVCEDFRCHLPSVGEREIQDAINQLSQ